MFPSSNAARGGPAALPRGQFISRVPSPAFSLDIVNSIVPGYANGSGTPTFTANSTRYQTDFEGKLNLVLANEVRFQGARRVRNLVANKSEDNTVGSSLKANATTTALTVSLNSVGASYWYKDGPAGVIGNTYRCRFVISSSVPQTVNALIGGTGGGNTVAQIPVTSAPQIVSISFTHTIAGAVVCGINNTTTNTQTGTYNVTNIHIEDVTVQTNQNPSEYVSVGVLSAPYHGANVDGVKYFSTLNGNTVTSNVVTEATGAAINSSQAACAGGVTAKVVDASGPLGEWSDPAQTDVLGTTDAIRRTMSNAGWVAGATMTKGTATGADGTAAIAASMTAGAVAATNTVLFTTVLGAAVRTFSALVRRKTGTGTVSITGDGGVTWTPITLSSVYQPFYFTTASAANPVVGFKVDTNLDAIEIDFNTLVAGSNKFFEPTPVNVNQAATVTQYVSSGNVPTNDFTVYGETSFPVLQPAASYFLWASYVDASNYTAVLWDGTNLIARKRIAGSNHDATKALTPTAGTRFKWAARFTSTTGTDIFHTGAIGTNDATNAACQIGAAFQIGADGNGANQPYATNANFRIYARALSDGFLNTKTT
jgi:hypothetical protein